MEYIVVIHREEEDGGYWAEVPALPGCYAQGDTLEDVLEDARDAIASHLEALREFGQPVPAGSVLVTTVTVPGAAA